MNLPDPTPFLDELITEVTQLCGLLDHLLLDHICYRVETLPEYEGIKRARSQDAKLLGESIVGGRPIATYQLNTPFVYQGRVIDVVEIPSPKPGSPYPTGYEHVEFVTDRPLPEFLDYLLAQNPALSDSLSTGGLAKTTNPDIRLSLPNGHSVKFHEQSLAQVILAESRDVK